MDPALHAHVRLDIASDFVLVDVRGSLTHDSRPSLAEIVRCIRRMGISARIRVDLGRTALVESSALAGLRHDLNAAARATPTVGEPLEDSVSLELNPRTVDPVVVLESLDLAAGSAASLGSPGTGPLARYTDDELFAASDAVFGMLDNLAMARPELLADYDKISLGISRRGTGSGQSLPDVRTAVPEAGFVASP